MESTDSSSSSMAMAMASPDQLPPGFRFHPTDEELLIHYLKRKAASVPLPVPIIADIDLYKFDPWELPDMASFGEDEWYFFSQRDRKYPNGARPNRAATSGYWKATGTDKPVMTQGGRHKLGVKKALVFYGGKPPKGIKTNWIMHEYRLLAPQSQYHNNNNNMRTITSTDSHHYSSNPSPPNPRYNCFHPSNSNSKPSSLSLRLDDWVLCRIYHKNNSPRLLPPQNDHIHASLDVRLTTLPIPPGLALPSPTPALHHCTLFQGLAAAAQFTRPQFPSSSSPLGHTALTELALPMKTTFPFLYYCSDGTAAAGRFHEDYYNNEQQTSTEDESSNAGTSTDLLMNQVHVNIPHDQRQNPAPIPIPIEDSTSTVFRPRHDPAFQLPGFNNCYT